MFHQIQNRLVDIPSTVSSDASDLLYKVGPRGEIEGSCCERTPGRDWEERGTRRR